MRKLFAGVGVVALLVSARTASAATITFDQCDIASLCGKLQLKTALNGSTIDVTVEPVFGNYGLFGDNNNNHALALNISGTGVSVSNITGAFKLLDNGGKISGITGNSKFEFLMDGPHNEPGAILPLTFTVTRSGGFLSDFDLFETNSAGYYAAAHLVDKTTGIAGHVAATLPPFTAASDPEPAAIATVPEPATMVLLGTGLIAAFRARKKR